MDTRRITRGALLTGVALTIFLVELQIPAPVPIPGVKLGLANIVTLYAMTVLGPWDTACILIARILLGSIFSGQMMALFYSLAGGTLCYFVGLLLRGVLAPDQIWVTGVLGAIAHNTGQILVAIPVTGTPAVLSWLPVLTVSGILSGLFTGLCARFLLRRFPEGFGPVR